MRSVGRVIPFVGVVALTFLGFGPAGRWLGQVLYHVTTSVSGADPLGRGDALLALLAIDAAALAITFGVSLAGGAALPSGLPHVTFGLFFPLMLGALQARFFELAGNADGLADTFGGYNFAAMFALTIVLAEAGITLARRRAERRCA